jgi:hypothetical protein
MNHPDTSTVSEPRAASLEHRRRLVRCFHWSFAFNTQFIGPCSRTQDLGVHLSCPIPQWRVVLSNNSVAEFRRRPRQRIAMLSNECRLADSFPVQLRASYAGAAGAVVLMLNRDIQLPLPHIVSRFGILSPAIACHIIAHYFWILCLPS